MQAISADYRELVVGHRTGETLCRLHLATGRVHGLDPALAWPMNGGPRLLRKALLRELRPLRKSSGSRVDWKSDPNMRWITVRDRGSDDSKGVPVLIRVHPDGSAHVVSGAGGSLTGMKLTRLRSPEELKVEAKARAERRKAERTARAQEMTPEEKQHHEKLREQADDLKVKIAQARAEALVETARALGWQETVKLPPEIAEQMDARQRARIERARERALQAKVKAAVNAIQDEVINQHNEQVAQSLGEVPIEEVALPELGGTGKGYMDALQSLAEENGLTRGLKGKTQDEVIDERLRTAEAHGYVDSAEAAKEAIAKLQFGAAMARIEDAPYREDGTTKPDVGDVAEQVRENPQQAGEVLRAYQRLKELEKQANKVQAELSGDATFDETAIARGSALLEGKELTDEELDRAAEEALSQRAQINAVNALMQEVEDFEGRHGERSLNQHLQSARYGELSAMYSSQTNEPLPIDRRVVDLLGIDAAATLAAEAMRQRMAGEDGKIDSAQAALIQRHVDRQAAIANAAVEAARMKIDDANALMEGLPALEDADADSLLLIQSRNQERTQKLQEAGQDLGHALGKLEAAGHLNYALRGPVGKKLKVAMGEMATGEVLKAAKALGFEEGEYEIEADGVNRFLTLDRDAALERLIQPTDPQVARDYADMEAIKNGALDEEGWLPDGFSRRSASDYHENVQHALGYDTAPNIRGAQDLEGAIRSYIGRCLAQDGAGSLHEIRQRMLSPLWQADNLDPDQRDAAAQYVSTLLDPKTVHGAKGAKLAEDLITEATAGDPDRTPLDNQTFDIDQHAYEAMHQALASDPAGRVAFMPLSDLTPLDKATLRSHFWTGIMGMGDRPNAAQVRKQREDLLRRMQEVVRTDETLFGPQDIRYGETDEGKAEFEQVFGDDANVDAWEFYVQQMGSVGNAYRALQDSIKGNVLEAFAERHGALTGQAMRTGKTPLAHAERHRIGTMSEEEYDAFSRGVAGKSQREQLADEMTRKLAGQKGGGQFASGSVKLRLRREAEGRRMYHLQAFATEENAPTRTTLGKTAEQQAARVASQLAPNYDPRRPVKVVNDVRMDGKYVAQQQGIKAVERGKRVGLHFPTGTGKTPTGLGAFAHLASQGKVKRGLFVVPPKQTGQWADEATTFMEPGRFRHYAGRSGAAEERRAAYADPNIHMVMVGHQALRDDLTWAVGKHFFDGDEMAARRALISRPEGGAAEVQTNSHHETLKALQSQLRRFPYLTTDPNMMKFQSFAEKTVRDVSSQIEAALSDPSSITPQVVSQVRDALQMAIESAAEDGVEGAMNAPRRSMPPALARYDKAMRSLRSIVDGLSKPPVTTRAKSTAAPDAAQREQHEQQQRRMVQEAARREGWDFGFSMIDEGHDALNRRGKPNSRLANVLDAITASHEYTINATATPVKNDVSETFDLLHKLRPDRYPLSKRDEFLRRYDSGDIDSVQEALRREVAPYFMPKSISTGVTRHNGVVPVQLSDRQKARYREVHQAYLAAKRAKAGTPEHTEAVMRLFPKSEAEAMTPAQQTAAAAQSAKFLHSRRDAMLNRVVHGHDEELKPEDVAGFNAVIDVAKQHANDDYDGGQLPGIVFANNPGVVRKLAQRMEREGLRVAVIDGTTAREQVDKIRQGFFPQGMHDPTDPAGSAAKIRQAAQYDIVVASNAASHGLNLQRAGWLYHIDDPSTAKTWQQRTGRADRIGALHDDVHVYTADYDAPYAKRRKRILSEKTPITEAFQKDHALLDQDETGTTQRIVERREENLGEALHAGIGAGRKTTADTSEEPAEPTAAEEYAAQEAAGQVSMF